MKWDWTEWTKAFRENVIFALGVATGAILTILTWEGFK